MRISHHHACSKGLPSTNAERRFRRLLAITLVASVAVLFASSLLTAWFIGRRIEHTIIVQIDRVMDSFTENSINVFLLNDPTVARSAVANLRSLPSIRTVAFLKRDYTLLFRTDEVALPRIPAKGTEGARAEGSQHWEDAEYLHFLAPVTTRPTATPFERSHRYKAADANRLGYLYVALDRGTVTAVKTFVFFVHALVVTVCGSALLLWFRRRARLMDAEVALMTAQLNDPRQSRGLIGGAPQRRHKIVSRPRRLAYIPSFNWSYRSSSSSWFRIYARTMFSSNPTVDTK